MDQPSTIGALPRSVVCAEGIAVGCLPGLATPAADLHPGETQTCARDAAMHACAARTLPHALRALKESCDELT